MKKKITTSGIVLMCIGAILFGVGMGLLVSLLIIMLNFDYSTNINIIPDIAKGVIGILVANIGSFFIKLGFGATAAGKTTKILHWYKDNFTK